MTSLLTMSDCPDLQGQLHPDRRPSAQGRFRATASGSDRPMRVVRRSASLVPPASLSGHSRIGADIGGVAAKSKQTPSAISAADHRERI